MFNTKYFLKKINPALIIVLVTVLFGSCKREMTDPIISTTAPELHIIVYQGADKTLRVAGATVQLYASADDRTAGQKMISTAVTNSTGEAVFAEKDFRKGTLYVSVTKDAVTVLATTPYLLQNDGKTLFWISK